MLSDWFNLVLPVFEFTVTFSIAKRNFKYYHSSCKKLSYQLLLLGVSANTHLPLAAILVLTAYSFYMVLI